MNKTLVYLLPFLLFSCNSPKENHDFLLIKNNWEIEDLQLNKSTMSDFERMMHNKKILFHKDSIGFFNRLNDSIEYCGNDYNLQNVTYKFSNDSLGMHFYFEKNYSSDSILFKNYEIANFEHIKFEQGFTNLISKHQLNQHFKLDHITKLYETKVDKNNVLIGVVALNDSTYEIKALNVYQDLYL